MRQGAEELRNGVSLEEKKRFSEAIALYLNLLKQNPRRYHVLCRLGLCYIQTGQAQSAVEWLSKAISLAPADPAAYGLRGVALRAVGSHELALKDFDRTILLNPKAVDAYFNRANALRSAGRYNESIADYQRAHTLDPARLDIMNNLAGAYTQVGEWAMASDTFEKLLKRREMPDSYYNLGLVKCELQLFPDALKCFEAAIRLKPDYAEAYSSRGYALSRIGDYDEALRSCDKAVALNPRLADAHVNRGKFLSVLGRHEEAVLAFTEAVEINPRHGVAHYYRGLAHKRLLRYSEARSDFDRALAINPDDQEARYSQAQLLLQLGEYSEGFSLYKTRWQATNFKGTPLNTNIPEWDGSPFAGRLLLWAEQGIGDEVFYVALLSLIPQSGMLITLAADQRLFPIYARSFPGVQLLDRKVQKNPLLAGFDAQAPIADLGRLLKLDVAKVAERKYPYLISNSLRKAGFIERFKPAGSSPLVGISWKTSNKDNGSARSIDLVKFLPIAQETGIRFLNLQYGEVSDEIAQARQLTNGAFETAEDLDIFNDLDGLLALIDACDFVLTIDNVTAHLAGSIGKKTAVMIPLGKGEYWYWQGKTVSEWYPSLDLLYQESVNDWSSALEAAAAWVKRQLPAAARAT